MAQFSSKAARNERVKLTANFINTLASGSLLAALIAPFVGTALGTVPVNNAWNLLGFGLFGVVWAIVLHLFARRVLSAVED